MDDNNQISSEVIDEQTGIKHFEAHGDRWFSLDKDSAKAMTTVIGTIVGEENTQNMRIEKLPGCASSLMIVGDAPAVPCAVLRPEGKDLHLQSFYPVLQGIPNLLEIEHLHSWNMVRGAEGDVYAVFDNKVSLCFFDPMWGIDAPQLAEGMECHFELAAWVYSLHKAEHKEIIVKPDSPSYEDLCLSLNGITLGDPITFSTRGLRALLPTDFACEYNFQAPVLSVEECVFCGYSMLRLKVELVGNEKILTAWIYASRHILKGYVPIPGDDVTGMLWLTGYICPEPAPPMPLQ